MHKKHLLFFFVVLIVFSFLRVLITNGQNKTTNKITLATGMIKNTILDRYYSPFIYSKLSFLPLNLGYSRECRKNIHMAGIMVNKSNMYPIDQPGNYDVNKLQTTYGWLYYEYFRELLYLPGTGIKVYAGIGNISHGATRELRVVNSLNPLKQYVDSIFQPYHIALLSLHFNVMARIETGKSGQFMLKGGIPLLNYTTRPYYYNPRFGIDELIWRWRPVIEYYGFYTSILYSHHLSEKLETEIGYNLLYFVDKKPYILKSLKQLLKLGINITI